MSQNVLSVQSSRRGAAERQRRWRHRQRVRLQTENRLRQRLGRAPTEAEVRDEIATQLAGLGLAPAPVDADRRAGAPAEAATDVALQVGEDDDDVRSGVTDFHGDPPSSRVLRELGQSAERRPPSGGPAQADGVDVGRGVALASMSFELRVAADRDKIYDMLMRRAEEGDASALLFLGSRLAPPARPRRVVSVPELLACDLDTSAGVQRGIEILLRKTAAGELPLDDAELLLRGLERRLTVAESASWAEAYRAASEALAARQGGLAERVAGIRARLAAEAANGTALLEAAPETLEERGWRT